MGLITKPNTFATGATVLAAEHNANFDTVYNLVNGNIDNANIKASAAIIDTKLAQLTTASKVHGTALTGLASITLSAGIIPIYSMPETFNMGEQSAAPTTAANTGSLYTKVDNATTTLFFRRESSGDEVQITSGSELAGQLIQQSFTVDTTAYNKAAIAFPVDNTIPQITEGVPLLSLSITPTAATSLIVIEVEALLSSNAAAANTGWAIFKDTDAAALKAGGSFIGSDCNTASIRCAVSAGSTAAATYTFRAGRNDGGDLYMNYTGALGTGVFAGTAASSIWIKEYKF